MIDDNTLLKIKTYFIVLGKTPEEISLSLKTNISSIKKVIKDHSLVAERVKYLNKTLRKILENSAQKEAKVLLQTMDILERVHQSHLRKIEKKLADGETPTTGDLKQLLDIYKVFKERAEYIDQQEKKESKTPKEIKVSFGQDAPKTVDASEIED